jgi:hypothetical protein
VSRSRRPLAGLLGLLLTALCCAVPATAAAAPRRTVLQADGWHAHQAPAAPDGRVRAARIRTVPAPGAPGDAFRPAGDVLRVELRAYDDPRRPGAADGDVTDTGGYLANRAEVYDRIATRATPAAAWPDPVGAVRWYAFSLYVPAGFPTEAGKWLDFTQWKGLDSGSPPVALELDGEDLVLGGKTGRQRLGRLVRGGWTRFVVGMRLSPDPRAGWVQVDVNGRTVLPRTHRATMETVWRAALRTRTVDPNYLKQGIYRSAAWTSTQVLYFGPMTIARSRAALALR